ncbi:MULTISPECIES: sensor histidine kinase [unclassified Paenibacillus]|uniref:sensor histidine kinase n=1 Tax=unclassified Paenibacillus TaxID=185978 RepID=UPI0002072903|nr:MULTISPECIES: histidine kinase [unclassified Paenibacillus]EGG34795.1 histidine kinase [Paenibacillus sp. HGF5]
MSYKQMKWLILIIPTLTIGIWEYVRHEFLLPYISMDLGNLLAPVIVFLVSILFLTQLFSLIERNQEELNRSRALQAAMHEREKIGRELHDGIAQSLFLLNAQIDRIEKSGRTGDIPYQEIKESVHRTNTYVREAIANLRYPADPQAIPWMHSMSSLIEEIKQETDLHFDIKWGIPDAMLSAKEKVELLASIRESLLNIHKHAEAKHVKITANTTDSGWHCTVTDDGKGFDLDKPLGSNRYGIKIMKDRAEAMGWKFKMERQHNQTIINIRKESMA